MPRLLPVDALEHSTRARWTAILATALAITVAANWTDLRDTARGLAPRTSDRHDWPTADLEAAPEVDDLTGLTDGIEDPARAASAHLATADLTLDLVWETPLTITEVRVETYEDAFGTGHLLALAADATTAAGGPDCLNARLTTPEGATAVHTCTRADRHPTRHQEPGKWYPDKLFITQTADLDPADRTPATQVDYYGLGLSIGDPDQTGVWGPNWWSPMMGHQYHDCDDTDLYADLDDLHLRPEYAEPTAHQGDPGTLTRGPARAAPRPGSLITPACIPVNEGPAGHTGQIYATEPFQKATPTALTGWTRYNAARTEPAPLRTALVVDVRSCDTGPDRCTDGSDLTDLTTSSGHGGTWMSELLGPDR